MGSTDPLDEPPGGKLSWLRKLERFGWRLAMRHDLGGVKKLEGRPERVNKLYDLVAPLYDAFFRRIETFRAGGNRLVQRTVRPGDRVLDLGTGTGINLVPLLQVTPRVVGLDLSEKMLKEANKWARKEKRHVALTQANALQLPFADGSFDSVIAAYMVVYLSREQTLTCLREVHRVLGPDGRFGILCGQGERSPRNPRREEWVEICYQAGFGRVEFDDFYEVLRVVEARK